MQQLELPPPQLLLQQQQPPLPMLPPPQLLSPQQQLLPLYEPQMLEQKKEMGGQASIDTLGSLPREAHTLGSLPHHAHGEPGDVEDGLNDFAPTSPFPPLPPFPSSFSLTT